jgi:hypothetical protein
LDYREDDGRIVFETEQANRSQLEVDDMFSTLITKMKTEFFNPPHFLNDYLGFRLEYEAKGSGAAFFFFL